MEIKKIELKEMDHYDLDTLCDILSRNGYKPEVFMYGHNDGTNHYGLTFTPRKKRND